MSVTVIDPLSGERYSVSDVDMLSQAIERGATVLRPDAKSAYVIKQFMGGWLLDDCPLNVVLGEMPTDDQIAALESGGLHCALIATQQTAVNTAVEQASAPSASPAGGAPGGFGPPPPMEAPGILGDVSPVTLAVIALVAVLALRKG